MIFKKVPKIENVEILEKYILRCTFNTGDVRDYDFSHAIATGPVFAPLKDIAVFNSVKLDNGALTWLDGKVDFDPCCILSDGVPV